VNLSIHYFFFHTPTIRLAGAVLLFLLIVTIAALAIGRSRRDVLVGWMWYLVTLVPVIGLVHVGLQSHADRYTYVPLIGIFLAVVFSLGDAVGKRPVLHGILGIGGFGVLLAMAAVTCKTVGYWKDDTALFGQAIAVQPENAYIRSALGKSLMKRQQYNEARVQLLASNAIRSHPETLYLLGAIAYAQNRHDEALDYFRRALAVDRTYGPAYTDAGSLLYELGRYDEAEEYLRNAVELDPAPASVHRLLAAVLAANKDHAGAAEEYRKSLEIEPDFSAWNNLGDAQENMGELAAAEESYRKALVIAPESAVAHYNLASTLDKLGRRNEAIAAAAKAVALDPNDMAARALHRQLKAGQHLSP
jgi:tetratricopeptide (TPR) repeat protein